MRADEADVGTDNTATVCESCGGDDDDLQPVWPASGSGESAELWCAGCREELPHEAAADGEEDAEGEGDETAEGG